MRRLLRYAGRFLVGCAALMMSPTGWLIEPHRMFIAESADGRDLVHFERDVPFPLYLRSDSAFVTDASGARSCVKQVFTWFHPTELDRGRAQPWPPHCETPPPPGEYHIYVEIRLCLWTLCARPKRFVSDEISVTRDGRYLPSAPAAPEAPGPAPGPADGSTGA